jgi:hypothetical protein
MAFILVQHLDPTNENLMWGLLDIHTKMNVLQAKDGKLIEPDHLYVIPPGTYLSVAKGYLHVSQVLILTEMPNALQKFAQQKSHQLRQETRRLRRSQGLSARDYRNIAHSLGSENKRHMGDRE